MPLLKEESRRIALAVVASTAHGVTLTQAIRGDEGRVYRPEDFTCLDCHMNDRCDFAFDLYNVDGDCLEMK